jgi:hypothetical protein
MAETTFFFLHFEHWITAGTSFLKKTFWNSMINWPDFFFELIFGSDYRVKMPSTAYNFYHHLMCSSDQRSPVILFRCL